jgi:hypothetical protein
VADARVAAVEAEANKRIDLKGRPSRGRTRGRQSSPERAKQWLMLIRRRSGPSHALTHSHAQPTKANQSGGTLTVLRWLDEEVGVLAEIAVDSPDIIDADRSPAIPSYARIVEHAGRKAP